MSIAVSAVVVPSRLLLLMTLTMSGAAIVIGLLTALSNLDALLTHPGPEVMLRAGLAMASICAGLHVAARSLRSRPQIRIDISGTGQIRMKRMAAPLSDAVDLADAAAAAGAHNADLADDRIAAHGMHGPLTLLPQSTIWSNLLVLRLQCELGNIHTLFVLPDTVSDSTFRMLSVACHWIAAHNIRAGSENT